MTWDRPHVREGVSGRLADPSGADPFLGDSAAPAASGEPAVHDDGRDTADAEVRGVARCLIIVEIMDGDLARIAGDSADGGDGFLADGTAGSKDFDGSLGARHVQGW